MKISNRMLITFGAIYIVASIAIVALVNYDMRKQALDEAKSKALMLLNHNLAIHNYLQELKPKLFSWSKSFRPPDYFDPAWMSSTYAIRQIGHHFKILENSKYYYKECGINARTAENEADPHERDFMEQLSMDSKLVEHSEVRMLNGQPVFVILRRGLEMKKSCLQCHSTPDKAPGDLVKVYGSTRGFGRMEGEVVHAISIRIPLAAAYAKANLVSWRLSGILLGLLGCLFASQLWISNRLLFDPMAALRRKAVEIAESEERLGETIPVPPGPELRDLTLSFNAMSLNLRQVHDSLEERVRQRTAALDQLNERLEQDILQRKETEESLRNSEERLHLLASQLLTTQETARKRLAMELHDGLGQSLMVLKLQLRSVEKMLPAETFKARDELDNSRAQLDGVIENIRRMSHSLLPSTLQDLGLKVALEQLLGEFQKHARIIVYRDIDDLTGAFCHEDEINIYRIVQESLANIAKHADATEIKLAVKLQNEKLAFKMEDNGKGFNAENFRSGARFKGGLGLTSMDERVHLLGGQLDITSAPGAGTRISFMVPYRSLNSADSGA